MPRKEGKIKRNVAHSDCIMKNNNVFCVHRFHNGDLKNQCELIGSECNNGLWSEQTCGLTVQINKWQREEGIK